MKKALAIALIGALFAGVSMAQHHVELDLDATLGNGPDNVSAAISDYVSVECWVFGDAINLISANFQVCNPDGCLEFQGWTDATGWGINSAIDKLNGCYEYGATDLNAVGLASPFLLGTAVYHAASHCIGQLIVDEDPATNGWMNQQFVTGAFDMNTNASVTIGGTATEQSNWGAVKELFR